jgi:hypothetical protein
VRTEHHPSTYGLTRAELARLKYLRTPSRIQDFLERLAINFETEGETCMSPRRVLREGRAHCFEGAVLSALCLRLIGYPPLLLDLKSVRHDDDHVVAVWQERGRWGSISKTNHAVLRYREPVYRSVRELAMSFFHEYFLDNGVKTLRSFSAPFDLARFDARSWVTDEKDMWYLVRALDRSPHESILTPTMIRTLRKADPIERIAGKLVVERPPRQRT